MKNVKEKLHTRNDQTMQLLGTWLGRLLTCSDLAPVCTTFPYHWPTKEEEALPQVDLVTNDFTALDEVIKQLIQLKIENTQLEAECEMTKAEITILENGLSSKAARELDQNGFTSVTDMLAHIETTYSKIEQIQKTLSEQNIHLIGMYLLFLSKS